MDSINRLTATLVKEKDTIGAAIDAMGPALKVLNRQHASLMKMLRQLDTLGVVGTRVIRASKDDVVASLKHLQPTLTKLSDAGDSLPRGLSLMASFPFPKEAATIARGDYANALFHVDLDLNKIIKSPGDNLPDVINLCAQRAARADRRRLQGARRRHQAAHLQPEQGAQGRALRRPERWSGTAQEPPRHWFQREAQRFQRRHRWVGQRRPSVVLVASSAGVADDDSWCQGPADRLPAAQRRRRGLRGGQLPRPGRPRARPRLHHPRDPAHVGRAVRGQRGHLPRRQGRQGLEDGRDRDRAARRRRAQGPDQDPQGLEGLRPQPLGRGGAVPRLRTGRRQGSVRRPGRHDQGQRRQPAR